MRAHTATGIAAGRRFTPVIVVFATAALLAVSALAPVVAGAATAAILEERVVTSFPVPSYEMAYFGWDVDVDGGTVVVGDHIWGTASVFRPSVQGWEESDRLTLGNGQAQFITLDGGRLAVGPRAERPPVAMVYPVVVGGGIDQSNALQVDGTSVALDGDVLVTGSANAVRVYRWDGARWSEIASLALIPGPFYSPGPEVAVSGTLIAFSDPTAGTVRILRVGVDDSITEIHQVPGAQFANLGLALSGDTLAVGANGHVDVYRETAGTWDYEAELVPANASADSEYPSSVDIDGDTVAVGARHDDHPNSDSEGSVFVFERTGSVWSEALKIMGDAVPGQNDAGNYRRPRFGMAVALDGDHLVVGAPFETVLGLGYGAAYIYRLSESGYPAGWMQAPAYLYYGFGETGRAMRWRNPLGATGFTATRVLKRAVTPPSGPNDPKAQIIYEGTEESCPEVDHPSGSRIHYAAYSRNAAGDWSKATTLTVTTPYWPPSIPAGDNVTVSSNGVTLTFPRVTTAGGLVVGRYEPLREPPSGRRWVKDGYLDIHPTTAFEGPVQVTVNFDASDAKRPETLSLDHWNGTEWEQISSAGANGGSIRGSVTSFSEFGVSEALEPSPTPPPVVGTPGSTPWSLLLGIALALGFALTLRPRTARH